MFILCSFPVWSENYETLSGIDYRNEVNDDSNPSCKLDLYYPTDVKDYPTVVWFHGGGLTTGRRSVPEELKNSGIAVVAVDYRLMPDVSLSDCIDDAAASIAWTFENIEKYGGSRKKIVVAGHSAGGYLTNMIGLDKKWLKKYNIDADSIAMLVPFSGHAISHFAYRKAKGMRTTQPSIDEFAPLYYVRSDAPELVIISGDRDKELLGRYEETAYLWRMMKENGHKKTFIYELEGFDHGQMVHPGFHILKSHIRDMWK